MRGVFNSKVITTMYSGGKGAGYDLQLLQQSTCLPETIETIFYGGDGVGYANQLVLQGSCLFPLIETIYYGGTGYGAVDQQLIQSICALPVLETIYFGGQSANFVNPNQIQSDCSQLPITTTTSIVFEQYYDLETGIVCSSNCDSPSQEFDLVFINGVGPVHARMWWNEQYSDMALVYNKTFDQLTSDDIVNYYYCEHINDENPKCDNTDTPPTDFVGIYKTYNNNYFAVQYLSETVTNVSFKFKKLN